MTQRDRANLALKFVPYALGSLCAACVLHFGFELFQLARPLNVPLPPPTRVLMPSRKTDFEKHLPINFLDLQIDKQSELFYGPQYSDQAGFSYRLPVDCETGLPGTGKSYETTIFFHLHEIWVPVDAQRSNAVYGKPYNFGEIPTLKETVNIEDKSTILSGTDGMVYGINIFPTPRVEISGSPPGKTCSRNANQIAHSLALYLRTISRPRKL